MASRTTLLLDRTRCSAFTVMAALVLLVTVASRLPAGARASALRPVSAAAADDHDGSVQYARHRRDVGPVTFDAAKTAVAAVAATGADTPATVRDKRSFKLLKLKPLIVLPAKVALGAGSKLVAGAKLGAKAVGVGAKAVGAGLVGLKALSKVAKVTVKAATALGIKAVLLNFLFHKINQVIDFKTRLLSNLDQKNRQQNALFLSGVLPQPASKPVSAGSVGNKDDDDFLASSPGDQQVLAQEQSKSSVVAPVLGTTAAPLEEDEITFDANKISLQVPDRLFGPSFTAVNSISQTIATVIQNTATRLARLVNAIKSAVFRKVSGVSSISNSSGGSGGGDGGANANRGSRDTAADADDGLDRDPLDEAALSSAAVQPTATKRSSAAAGEQ